MRALIAVLLLLPSLASAQVTVPQHTGWKVSPEQAAELTRQGYQRRIEPLTGNEQWVKSLTHDAPLPSQVLKSDCDSHGVLKVGGS